MSYTYATFTTELALMCAIDAANADFLSNLPSAIDYAEQRIYREADLLSTVVRDSSANVTANTTLFTLPSSAGRFVVLQAMNIVTPVGSTTSNGTRNPLTSMSLATLDTLWPSEAAASATTIPQYFAMITDQTVKFGPPPGAAFNIECIGTIRPTPLSASNTTTFLTLYLPDIFIAAAMVWMSAYMKNFGAQSDNPQSAVSWESQYQTLFASVNLENMRRKFGSVSWTAMQPSPMATSERG